MLGLETVGNSTEVEVDTPEPGADRRTSWQGVDRSSIEVEVDSRPLEVGGLDAAQPCSIAAARRRCMRPAVSEHNSMTSLMHFCSKT